MDMRLAQLMNPMVKWRTSKSTMSKLPSAIDADRMKTDKSNPNILNCKKIQALIIDKKGRQ